MQYFSNFWLPEMVDIFTTQQGKCMQYFEAFASQKMMALENK
jgi:hypothetical protein